MANKIVLSGGDGDDAKPYQERKLRIPGRFTWCSRGAIAVKHYEHYSMVIEWSDEDDAYIVTVPELPGCVTHGATYEEVARQGQDAIDSWLDAQHASGCPLPAPHTYTEQTERVAD